MTYELELGIAGEHIVCADLLGRRYRAFMSEQNCPYDVAMEYNGKLIRIQVRTTGKPKYYPQKKQEHVFGYIWYLRVGKGGKRNFNPTSFDIIALVAFDTKQIAYISSKRAKTIIQIPVSGNKTDTVKKFSDFSLENALLDVIK